MDIKLPDSTLRRYLKTKATPQDIAKALTLSGPSVDRLHKIDGDYVYDIEVITNRVDSASAFGIAREAVAILPQHGFKAELINNPYEIKTIDLPNRTSQKLKLEVEIQDKTLIKRFAAIVLDQLKVQPSPKEIVKELELSGIRSINNLVDITNYLTLCFGQPLHVFDYDKITDAKMILRQSKSGEKIITLDNKTHTLKGGDIVIEDGAGRLIDLCGIMGGKLSEVDEKTTKAVIFVQTYNPKKIRFTSLYTQERTLAAQIFEKQPDTRLVAPTLIEATKMFLKLAGGRIASDSIDLYFDKPKEKSISLNLNWLNGLIGFKFTLSDVSLILKKLGFTPKKSNNYELEVGIPTWRLHDINIPGDLAEEVARVYGYFRLESVLPESRYLSTTSDPLLNWEYQTKNYLTNLGFTEIFNYSLVSEEIFTKANLTIDHSIKLLNPLASEFEYMRRSLIPSILMDLENNQGKVDLPLRIFELANIYLPNNSNKLPDERPILVMATQQDDFRHAKGYLEALLENLHIKNPTFKVTTENIGPWQANQTAEIYVDNKLLGFFGAINSSVKKNFKLEGDVYLANLDFHTISTLANSSHNYTNISEYPDVIEDLTLESGKSVGELIELIKDISKFVTKVTYTDSLRNKHTFRVHFNNPDKNLTQEEVNSLKEKLFKVIKE